MIYLASPYSDPDPAVREARFQAVCRKAAAMLRCGVTVFSPIAHTHPIAAHGLPMEWAFWKAHDHAFLEACSEVRVLMLDGRRESKGLSAEIALASELRKPVVYVEPCDDMDTKKNTPAGTGVSKKGSQDATC